MTTDKAISGYQHNQGHHHSVVIGTNGMYRLYFIFSAKIPSLRDLEQANDMIQTRIVVMNLKIKPC